MDSILKTEFPWFFYYLDDGRAAIGYIPKYREFVVKDIEIDSSAYTALKFCPWTGKKFPSSVRDEFFDTLEGMGIEYHEAPRSRIPLEFHSERWWINRGL